MYGGYIDTIHGAANGWFLINGQPYTVDVTLMDFLGSMCNGTITMKIDGATVGTLPGCIDGPYSVPISFTGIAPGKRILSFHFSGANGLGSPNPFLMNQKEVTITPFLNTSNINSNNSIALYPLPASDMLTIKLPTIAEVINELKIVNITGQVIKVMHPLAVEVNVDVDNLPSGMYILQIQTNNSSFNEKIVVAH
jgi:hypothetical protein